MSETTLRYEQFPGTIGATLELENLEEVTAEARALAALQAMLDERGVIAIRTRQPIPPAQLAVVERIFGVSGSRGTAQPLVTGTDFLVDYSSQPKFDDGRPRKIAPTDFIHIDTLANGPAAFGVHVTVVGSSVEPMRFVDMRAVYATRSEAMKHKLANLRARHSVPPRADCAPQAWTMQPLAARHPRTGAALLLLPNRYDNHVDGLRDAEASALITELWRTTDVFPERLELPLRPNTLILWDNITCTHTNPGFPRGEGRVVWFFNILNDRAVQPVQPVTV